MSIPRTVLKLVAAGVVAAGALFAGASANAETHWSIGVNLPGLVVGQPAPVYYEPGPSWEERRAERREWRRREWERREHYRHYREDRD